MFSIQIKQNIEEVDFIKLIHYFTQYRYNS